MADPDKPVDEETLREAAFGGDDSRPLTGNVRAFTRMVRNLMFRHVQLFAMEKERELAELDSHLDDAPDWPSLMDDYFGEYDDVDLGPAARGPRSPSSYSPRESSISDGQSGASSTSESSSASSRSFS